MNEPLPWIFFCNREDYSRFRALVHDYPLFRPRYDEFVRLTDEQIGRDAEQQTLRKISIRYEDFLAYRSHPGIEATSDLELLYRFTHLSSGEK